MGDPLGSLVRGSQMRTILCVIGVGCNAPGSRGRATGSNVTYS
jgi:hypothetical protein